MQGPLAVSWVKRAGWKRSASQECSSPGRPSVRDGHAADRIRRKQRDERGDTDRTWRKLMYAIQTILSRRLRVNNLGTLQKFCRPQPLTGAARKTFFVLATFGAPLQGETTAPCQSRM